MESSSDLIPGLPNDLALLCLAYLPRRLHPLASCVSHAWKHAFESHALLSLRRKLGTLETWLFLCLQGDNRDVTEIHTYTYSWWVIDPALCPTCAPIGSPPFPPVRLLDYDVAICQSEVLLAATAYLDRDTAITVPMEEICRLDVSRRRWLRPSPPNMLTRRKLFTSASLDDYVYVAGGGTWKYVVLGVDDHVEPPKSVERLDCKTMSSWERLPDMHVARIAAGGVVLNGCFHVIGGHNDTGNVFSGEIWDTRNQKWVLEPELYPYHIFKKCSVGPHRSVAVVMESLFAIKQDWHDNKELMVYNSSTKMWTSLGCIPIENFSDDGNLADDCVCDLFGVGKDLWIVVHNIYEHDMFIIACAPLSGQSISWRRLPYSFHYFLLYLGIAITV